MARIQARVPDDIQDIANLVIKSTGLTVSDVVRMFMTRIAADKALPLDLFRPNTETLRAIEDAEAGRLTPTSLDELMADIANFSRSTRSNVFNMPSYAALCASGAVIRPTPLSAF